METTKKLTDILVCPYCREKLCLNKTLLNCKKCNKSFPVIDTIPVFIEDSDEICAEGVAVRPDSAIELFKREIDPDRVVSGKLFDRDLDNKDLAFLDVGCGIGRHLLILRNNGIKNASGFDIIFDLVRIAKFDYNLKDVFVAGAGRIPLPDRSIDRCLFYNVIEHCSDPYAVLGEIYRVLSDGGKVYMDVPNSRSAGDRLFRWGGKIIYGKTSHIQKFTRDKIEAMVSETGFQISKIHVLRGIFVDYPQLDYFGVVKYLLKKLFGREISGWELILQKNT